MPPPPGITPPASDIVTLSLISHTNAGKTTLARTLLRRDVGEVRDAAHVTLQNESFTLLEQEARRLQLWDTPGFGDSARLLKRLRRERNPVLWFLSQTWDRLTDRPLWCSQQALRNVRDEADVVLYLVNATEPPDIAAYIRPEMEVLAWVGKPVLVLLNQTGPARTPTEEEAETHSWRQWFREFDHVKGVLSLDAFARCWVQENHLMEAIAPLLPDLKQEAFKHLKKAWLARNQEIYKESIKAIATLLTDAVSEGVVVRQETLLERIGLGRSELNQAYQAAREQLASSLAGRVVNTTNELIRLHGLEGEAARQLTQNAETQFHNRQPVSEAIWSVLGTAAGGAMGGLIADLKMGGMSFGGGALVGGLAAGLGAYALIKSYNLVRGSDHRLHWSREHFREQVRLALLTYLAVAHFGRGRGEWQQSADPAHWNKLVGEIVDDQSEKIHHLWEQGCKASTDAEAQLKCAQELVGNSLDQLLQKLYPSSQLHPFA
jgi:hypothetical protein